MKKLHLLRLAGSIALLSLFPDAPAFADGIPTTAPATSSLIRSTQICASVPYVYYINGIWNRDPDADGGVSISARAIELAMTAAGKKYAAVVPLFNPSEGTLLDIFRKLLVQKSQEAAGVAGLVAFAEDAGLAAGGQANGLSSADAVTVNNAMANGVADAMKNLPQDAAAMAILSADLSQVVPRALQGNKVVLVAHSEGNMFAQQIYANVTMPGVTPYNPMGTGIGPAFQVVNVATPAAKADTGKYITSGADTVISDLSALLAWVTNNLAPAAPNVHPGVSSGDLSGHQFVQTYMSAMNTGVPGPVAATMQGEVARLVGLASDDTVAVGANVPYPVSVSAMSYNNVATYTVKADFDDSWSSSVTVPASGGTLPILQLTCDQLRTGTFHIVASAMPQPWSTQPPSYGFDLGLFLNQFGPSPVGTSGLSLIEFASPSRLTETFPVADLAVQPDDKTGGWDISLLTYH